MKTEPNNILLRNEGRKPTLTGVSVNQLRQSALTSKPSISQIRREPLLPPNNNSNTNNNPSMLASNGSSTVQSGCRLTKKHHPKQNIFSTPEFKHYYSFLTPEQQTEIRRRYPNQKLFSEFMREMRESREKTSQNLSAQSPKISPSLQQATQDSGSTRDESCPDHVYFPRNTRNLNSFLGFLKERNHVEQQIQNQGSPVEDKIGGIMKLFALTRGYENDYQGIELSEDIQKKKLQQKRLQQQACFSYNGDYAAADCFALPKTKNNEIRERNLKAAANTLYDDYGNPEATFKKLTKMSIGIEHYKSQDKAAKNNSPNPNENLINHFQISDIASQLKAVKPKQHHSASASKHTPFSENTRKLRRYQDKLHRELMHPSISLKLSRSNNFNVLRREVNELIQKASNQYGLTFKAPFEVAFNDDELKREILNLELKYTNYLGFTSQMHDNSQQTQGVIIQSVPTEPDQSVPKQLIKTLDNWHKGNVCDNSPAISYEDVGKCTNEKNSSSNENKMYMTFPGKTMLRAGNKMNESRLR